MAFKIAKKYLRISFSIKIKTFSIFSRMNDMPTHLHNFQQAWHFCCSLIFWKVCRMDKWMGLGKFSKHPILVPKQYLLFCDQHAKILYHISEVYQHFWDLNRHLIYAICNVLVPKNSKISAGNCQILESIIWNGSGAKILV